MGAALSDSGHCWAVNSGSIEARQILRLVVAFAVEIKEDECDAEEWLDDSEQDTTTQFEKIDRLVSWSAGHHFLQNRLRILRRYQLVVIILN